MKNNTNDIINSSKTTMYIDPLISYDNADTKKIEILKANKQKTGIYR